MLILDIVYRLYPGADTCVLCNCIYFHDICTIFPAISLHNQAYWIPCPVSTSIQLPTEVSASTCRQPCGTTSVARHRLRETLSSLGTKPDQ